MKIFKKLLGFSMLIPLLVACDGGSSNTNDPSEPNNDATTSEVTPESSPSASSSQEETPKEKLVKNIKAMNNYRIDAKMEMKSKVSENTTMEMTMVNTMEIVKNGYKTITVETGVQKGKLSEYVTQYGMTVEQFVAAYPSMPEEMKAVLTFDAEADTFEYDLSGARTGSSNSYFVYRYDATDKQYIEYQMDKTTNEIKRVKYSLDQNEMVEMNSALLLKAIDSGTFTEATSTYKYTLTEEDKNNEEFSDMTNGMPDAYLSLSLKVENNYPKELSYEVDLDVINEKSGSYFGELTEYKYSIAFSKIGSVTLALPTEAVECDYHMPIYHTFYNGTHRLICSDCYKFLGEAHEHEYASEEYQICKVCGEKKGYNDSVYEVDENHLLATDTENDVKLYAYAVRKGADGKAYSIDIFHCDTDDYSYRVRDHYDIKNDKEAGDQYCADLGVAIRRRQGEGAFLLDNCCLRVIPSTYEVYTGLTIEDDGKDVKVGEQTLAEYLTSATPAYSVIYYQTSLEANHDTDDDSTKVEVNDCLTVEYLTCDRCGEKFSYNKKYNHEFEYEVLTKANFVAAFADTDLEEDFDSYGVGDSNCTFLKASCKNCDDVHYYVFNNDQNSGKNHLTDDFEAIEVVATDDSKGYDQHQTELKLPHIYGSDDNCVLCGEAKA